MRFVRLAKTYEEQNLIICQQNDGIVFLTTRNIMPKEELKAGPSHDYGKRRNLTVLVSKQGNSSGKLFFPNNSYFKNLFIHHCSNINLFLFYRRFKCK